jgi:hypothetical protein
MECRICEFGPTTQSKYAAHLLSKDHTFKEQIDVLNKKLEEANLEKEQANLETLKALQEKELSIQVERKLKNELLEEHKLKEKISFENENLKLQVLEKDIALRENEFKIQKLSKEHSSKQKNIIEKEQKLKDEDIIEHAIIIEEKSFMSYNSSTKEDIRPNFASISSIAIENSLIENKCQNQSFTANNSSFKDNEIFLNAKIQNLIDVFKSPNEVTNKNIERICNVEGCLNIIERLNCNKT